MDKPDNGSENGPRTTRRSLIRQLRELTETAEEERQMVEQYQPVINEQIQRLFAEYEPPLYVRLRGFDRAQVLDITGALVTAWSVPCNRKLSGPETEALAENSIASIHAAFAAKWAVTGIAGFMTYRRRNIWRLPKIMPDIPGRFNPISGHPLIKISWNVVRFTMYSVLLSALGLPLSELLYGFHSYQARKKDPRLALWLQDVRSNARGLSNQTFVGQRGTNDSQHGDSWRSQSQTDRSANQAESDGRSSIPAQARSAWSTYRQSGPSQAPPQRDSSDGLADDIDDASPVVSSAQDGQGDPANYGGSAWDRVRQQSRYQPRRDRQQGQQTWEEPRAASGGWGSDNDDASPQYRGSRDSYSFSSADEEKAVAKSQAQKEFDELLDKERRGVDQEQKSWSRR